MSSRLSDQKRSWLVNDFDALKAALGDGLAEVQELWRWPESGDAYLRIVSNHQRPEWTDRLVCSGDGPAVRLAGVRGLTLPHGIFSLEAC